MMHGLRSLVLFVAAVVACMVAASMPGEQDVGDNTIGERPSEDDALGLYIIAYAPQLQSAATAWAEYRASRGWRTLVIAVDASFGDRSARARQQEAQTLRSTIRRAINEHRKRTDEPVSVLLLGDAPGPVERVDEQTSRALVPTFLLDHDDPELAEPSDPRMASDHPYQLRDDDATLPAWALGRIPARSNEQALALLAKVRRHEQRVDAGWSHYHVEYVAGEGHYGALDRMLEFMAQTMIDSVVDDRLTVRMSYADPESIYCPPPDRLTETVLEQLSGGALLFNYIGHGSAHGFDSLWWGRSRTTMLTVKDVASLRSRAANTPLALLTCCSAGWFDLKQDRQSLAEALLFHEAGPVCVLASSRNSHPYANTVLQHHISRLLLDQSISTIGELDRQATISVLRGGDGDGAIDVLALPLARLMRWPASLKLHRQMQARLYNLLGDPATLMPHPPAPIETLSIDEAGNLTGSVAGLASGVARVTIESARTQPARADQLESVTGDKDPDLPRKAGINHRLANERVLHELTVTVDGERLEVVIPTSFRVQPAALIRVWVSGAGAHGEPMRAIGIVQVNSR